MWKVLSKIFSGKFFQLSRLFQLFPFANCSFCVTPSTHCSHLQNCLSEKITFYTIWHQRKKRANKSTQTETLPKVLINYNITLRRLMSVYFFLKAALLPKRSGRHRRSAFITMNTPKDGYELQWSWQTIDSAHLISYFVAMEKDRQIRKYRFSTNIFQTLPHHFLNAHWSMENVKRPLDKNAHFVSLIASTTTMSTE